MDPSSLNEQSFTLKQGAALISGSVTYFNKTATFTPAAELTAGATYSASISNAARDLAGKALKQAYVWSFTTDVTEPIGPAPVALGAAAEYVILAKSAISNLPTSVINGPLGLSPAAESYITGFALTRAGVSSKSGQVTGSVFAADNDPPTPSDLTTAVGDMQAAYTDAANRSTPTFLDLAGGAIGGMTLAPGLYKWGSSVAISSDVTLTGAHNDVWIFQISGDLTLSAAKSMILSGGAQAKNIVWQVAGLVDLGTTAHAEGIVLSKTQINLQTGASINGRLLAQTAVHLAGSTVTAPTL